MLVSCYEPEIFGTYMNATPTMPNPTTTIRFLLVSFGSSPFSSIFSIFSGRTFASASFHSLLLMLLNGMAKMNEK